MFFSSTIFTVKGIQEARECCGGHGYLKASNIGELRNNHDATVTYEGDNNVLGQQASNWLLKQWTNGADNIESPLGTVNFLKRHEEILRASTFKRLQNKNLSDFDFIIGCYEWLMCHILNSTNKQMKAYQAKGSDAFTIKNKIQVYQARVLSSALAEYYAIVSFKIKFESQARPAQLKEVLSNIFAVYGFWNLDKHLASFYIGGFAEGAEFADFVRSNLMDACERMKDSSVSIADALSPPGKN